MWLWCGCLFLVERMGSAACERFIGLCLRLCVLRCFLCLCRWGGIILCDLLGYCVDGWWCIMFLLFVG